MKYHLFGKRNFENFNYAKYGYARMAELMREGHLGDDLVWLADMQEKAEEPLYVDMAHYTPQFNKEVASAIYKAALKLRIARLEGCRL